MSPADLAEKHDDSEFQAANEGLGLMYFLSQPVFEIEAWVDDGQRVVHILDLDLVATGSTDDDAIDNAGAMVMTLFDHLLEDANAGLATDAEAAQLQLILKRLGPVALRAYRRERLRDLFRRLRRMIGGRDDHDWVIGRGPSTLEDSKPALHA